MSACPENPNSVNCGLEAANFLVKNRAIMIDPFDEGWAPIRIAESASNIEEVLDGGRLVTDSRGNVAQFKCLECLDRIEIIYCLGDLSVERSSD
jgi:hypothetical protein